MPEILVKQKVMTDIKVYTIQDYIAIKQDNGTIYLEKSKAVELQKAINQLKQKHETNQN